MQALKIHCFLFLAVFMLVAKPFVGFTALKYSPADNAASILVKAFTKRKQEYVEDSNFDILTIQKRLANPFLALTVLFSALLNALFPSVFQKTKQLTTGILSGIHLNLLPPLHRYLLAGKLII